MKKILFFIVILIGVLNSINGNTSRKKQEANVKLSAAIKQTQIKRSLKSKKDKKGSTKNGKSVKALFFNSIIKNNKMKLQKISMPPMSAIHNRILEDVKNKKILNIKNSFKKNYRTNEFYKNINNPKG